MSAKYKEWMKASTANEKRELARQVDQAVGTLYQYGYDDPVGGRVPTVETARKIEEATRKIHRVTKGKLPIVSCGSFDKLPCSECRYYKAHKGNK
jgi:hypothetical protein